LKWPDREFKVKPPGGEKMNTSEISLFVTLYNYMVTAREIDRLEESYIHQGKAPFQVSGSGHEGTVALAPHLQSGDWMHCHYRDKAFMLARGVPISMFFHTLFAKDASCSHDDRWPHLWDFLNCTSSV
jgi:2-oxoisovalerate dehydrogenase E1 component